MLLLSEDQKLLMASARGAVAEKAAIAEFRKLRKDPNGPGFSPAFWRAAAELGWTGVLVPEAFGGLDFGVVGAGLIAREMARDLALSPFLSTSVLSASALARAGSKAQKAEWLPRIARDETIVAFALDEGARTGAIEYAGPAEFRAGAPKGGREARAVRVLAQLAELGDRRLLGHRAPRARHEQLLVVAQGEHRALNPRAIR